MIIKILGPGCTSCVALERVTRDAGRVPRAAQIRAMRAQLAS